MAQELSPEQIARLVDSVLTRLDKIDSSVSQLQSGLAETKREIAATKRDVGVLAEALQTQAIKSV